MLLRAGSSGDEVKGLQRGLNKLGSMLLIDGRFGSSGLRSADVTAIAVILPDCTIGATVEPGAVSSGFRR